MDDKKKEMNDIKNFNKKESSQVGLILYCFGLCFVLAWLIAITVYFAETFDNKENTIQVMNVGISPAGIALKKFNASCCHACDSSRIFNGDFIAYVANDNNYGIAGQDSVSVINLSTRQNITTIFDPSFEMPYTVTFYKNQVFVTNSEGTTISVIDPCLNKVVRLIGGFNGPSGLAISCKTGLGYVINYGAGLSSGNGNTVTVFNVYTGIIVDTIIVGQAPAAIAIGPNCCFVYVVSYINGNPGIGILSVIETKTNQVVQTIGGFSGPFDIKISNCGNTAFVSNFGSNNFAPFGTTVSVVNLKSGSIVNNIQVGIQPSSLALSNDNQYLYVSNYNTLYAGAGFTDLTSGQSTISKIDLSVEKVVETIFLAGQSCANIVLFNDSNNICASFYTSNSIQLLTL